MSWKTIPGLAGKVYVPEILEDGKKHPCKDCFACQNCSQERCRICQEEKHDRHCLCFSHKGGAP